MLGHGQLGVLAIGQVPSAQRMLITAIGSYAILGTPLFFAWLPGKVKLRLAKPMLYQVRQVLGLLGR